jgi:large subunit ribosomal protein L10
MTREEKNQVIEEISSALAGAKVVYLADTSGMTVETTSKFRRACFEKNIQLRVVKNTLLKKAMERSDVDYSGLFTALHGTTALMLAEASSAPAKLIKSFRKKDVKPAFKGALVESEFYIGESNLENLVNIKSREELIGDIIAMLQSPARNVISALTQHAEKKQNEGGE